MPLSQDADARAADTLLEARRNRAPIAGLPDDVRPADEADAYRIQQAYLPKVMALAGGATMVGSKVGATNAAVHQRMSLTQPFRGALLSSVVHASPARIAGDAMMMRVLEVEFAFRMGRDLPATGAPYGQEAVADAIAALVPAIEVVDSRYADWTKAGGLQLIADNASAGHWVYGQEITDWRDIDLADYPVSLTVNGKTVAEGSSANVLGHPLIAMTWLANALAASGDGLKAGQVIASGACTTPVMSQRGDKVVAGFGRLGQVSVDFD